MLAALLPALIPQFFKAALDAFTAYQNKQITLAQLEAQLGTVWLREATKWEEANTEMVARTFATFGQMLMSSKIVQRCYAFVVITQTCVLIWVQVGIPYLVWKYGGTFPSPGATIDWAYALLVLLLGGGIAAMRRPQQPRPLPPKGG